MDERNFVIRDSVLIQAPIERCFELSTHLALVQETLGLRTASSGLVRHKDQVQWRGWKFGLPQAHLSEISEYERPRYFQDTQLKGRFAFFQHDHWLREVDGGTLLEDEVRFRLPFGVLGRVVARMVLVPHVRGLVKQRFALLKRVAEGNEWRRYLAQDEWASDESGRGGL